MYLQVQVPMAITWKRETSFDCNGMELMRKEPHGDLHAVKVMTVETKNTMQEH